MSDCECSFVPPIVARSFTGPTARQVVCDVNGHTNIKHWVVVKNKLGYAAEIYVSARISEPRLVRFSDCPDFDLPSKGYVRDDFWESSVDLDMDDEYVFGVLLLSDAQNGSQQRIDIRVATMRIRDDSDDSVDRQYGNHITVTA